MEPGANCASHGIENGPLNRAARLALHMLVLLKYPLVNVALPAQQLLVAKEQRDFSPGCLGAI